VASEAQSSINDAQPGEVPISHRRTVVILDYFLSLRTRIVFRGRQEGLRKSGGIGIGPQIGYIFPVGNMQGYLNLKAYGEFAAADRPSG
jgi:hypothetical protein